MSRWKPHQPRGATLREVNNGQNFKWRPIEPIEFTQGSAFVQWKEGEMTRGEISCFLRTPHAFKKTTTNKQTEITVRPLCTSWSLGIHTNSWFHQKPSGPNWTSGQSSIYHWPFVITGEHTESAKIVYTHIGKKKTCIQTRNGINASYVWPLKLSIRIEVWGCKLYIYVHIHTHTYILIHTCVYI